MPAVVTVPLGSNTEGAFCVSERALFETILVLLPQIKDLLSIAALDLFVISPICRCTAPQRPPVIETPILTVLRALLVLSQRSEAASISHWLALTI
jgi:hypothetical protein